MRGTLLGGWARLSLALCAGLVFGLSALVGFARADNGPPPINNECAARISIEDGVTAFSTLNATTDGLPHLSCQFDGQTYADIWYN